MLPGSYKKTLHPIRAFLLQFLVHVLGSGSGKAGERKLRINSVDHCYLIHDFKIFLGGIE